MKTCADFEVLVSLRAAGALEGEDAARLAAHLEGCPSCRAAAAESADALALAALPPISEAERRALRDLPARALDAIRRGDRRRAGGKRLLAAVVAAAAAAALVLAPAIVRKSPAVSVPASVEVAAWEGPDLDALWEDAGVLDLDPSASSGGEGADDVVYAALDY